MAQHSSLRLEAENLNLRTANLLVLQTMDCKSSGFSSSKGSTSGKEKQKEGMKSYTDEGTIATELTNSIRLISCNADK